MLIECRIKYSYSYLNYNIGFRSKNIRILHIQKYNSYK